MYTVHYLTSDAQDVIETVKADNSSQAESIVLNTNKQTVIILSIFKH